MRPSLRAPVYSAAMPFPNAAKAWGIAALVVLDLVLVGYVLSGGSTSPKPTASPTTRTPGPSVTTSATATAGPTLAAASRPRTLAVVDQRTGFRAGAPSCTGARPEVERSTDGGRTWKSVGQPAVASVTRLQFTTTTAGYVVAAAKGDCALRVLTTRDGGATWSQPRSAKTYWSLLPGSATKVNTAAGSVVEPCVSGDVLQLARISDPMAVVLCGNGDVRRTADGGRRWSTLATVAGAQSLAPGGSAGDPIALAGTDDGCDGVRIWTLPGSSNAAESAACVSASTTEAATASIARTPDGAATWLALGDAIRISGGDLSTWTSPS